MDRRRAAFSAASMRRRPTPNPRADGATHNLLISAISPPVPFSPTQPIGKPSTHGHKESAARADHVVGLRVSGERHVEAVLEPARQFGIVFAKAASRLVASGVHFLDRDPAASERGGHDIHRRQKCFGMGMAPKERFGPGIRQSLVGLELSLPSGRQLRDTATRVVGMRYGPDEAFFLQPA